MTSINLPSTKSHRQVNWVDKHTPLRWFWSFTARFWSKLIEFFHEPWGMGRFSSIFQWKEVRRHLSACFTLCSACPSSRDISRHPDWSIWEIAWSATQLFINTPATPSTSFVSVRSVRWPEHVGLTRTPPLKPKDKHQAADRKLRKNIEGDDDFIKFAIWGRNMAR